VRIKLQTLHSKETKMYSPQIGDSIDSLDTPSMIVDLDIMEKNIAKLMARLVPKVKVRPHLKTTKSPILAKKLIDAGATGGCVAKLSEAIVMAEGGVDDIMITCEIVGPVKVGRLVDLFSKHRSIRIVVDSVEGATAINEALSRAGFEEPIQTLIDVNVGQHRTGVMAGDAALELAQKIRPLAHLRLIGVHGYEGHLQHVHSREEREESCRKAMTALVATANTLRDNGFDIQVVTTGGTGTAEVCASMPGVTEVQPGSFIFMDSDYRNAIGDFYSHSLSILATVISKPEAKRAVIDAGLKTLTTDSGYAEPKDLPGYKYVDNGDEHGSITWESGPGLAIGDRIEMIPSHIDPTINLHDTYYAHRNGKIEEIWPVATRGKVQ
jgi:D-serine deaminase-like pyridoxal phosphate-dependent protein